MKMIVYMSTGRRNNTAVLVPTETPNKLVITGIRRKKASPVESEQFLTRMALSEIRMSGISNIQRIRSRRARRASSLNAGSDRSERTAARPRLLRGDPGFILSVGRPPGPEPGPERYRHLSQLVGRIWRRFPPLTAPTRAAGPLSSCAQASYPPSRTSLVLSSTQLLRTAFRPPRPRVRLPVRPDRRAAAR